MEEKKAGIWDKIGFHETPNEIVDEFSKFTIKKFKYYYRNKPSNSKVSILDLFAGDGRLGNKIGKNLISHFYPIYMVFIEIDKTRYKSIKPSVSCFELINANAFKWDTKKKYDLVVSNPPYKILNAMLSKNLGFPWEMTKRFSRNLFGLGIIRGLELCKEGGVLAVIAPFSWLRGIYSQDFRREISLRCSNVLIRAHSQRHMFNGINQDIGFQIFIKRKKDNKRKASFKFSYDGLKSVKLDSSYSDVSSDNLQEQINIRVGPIVWNRKKSLLTAKNKHSIPLIFGGNIRPNAKLDLEFPKYLKKQYIAKNELKAMHIVKAPLILIRRTMRGTPGNWKIDSCLIFSRFECAVENHVIVIELPSKINKYRKLHKLLIDDLSKYYYISGSPTISVKIVKEYLRKILNSKFI